MDQATSISDVITAVVGLVSAVLVIAGIIVKLTKTKKDDEILAEVEGVVKPVVDSLDPKKAAPKV